MRTGKGTVAQQLSEHIVRLDYRSLPANVIAKVKEALLDQLGCQLVGSTMDWCRIIYEFTMRRGSAGRPEATVVNHNTDRQEGVPSRGASCCRGKMPWRPWLSHEGNSHGWEGIGEGGGVSKGALQEFTHPGRVDFPFNLRGVGRIRASRQGYWLNVRGN